MDQKHKQHLPKSILPKFVVALNGSMFTFGVMGNLVARSWCSHLHKASLKWQQFRFKTS